MVTHTFHFTLSSPHLLQVVPGEQHKVSSWELQHQVGAHLVLSFLGVLKLRPIPLALQEFYPGPPWSSENVRLFLQLAQEMALVLRQRPRAVHSAQLPCDLQVQVRPQWTQACAQQRAGPSRSPIRHCPVQLSLLRHRANSSALFS